MKAKILSILLSLGLIVSPASYASNVSGGGGATADDTAYGVSWNGNTDAATKNAIYDKIETVTGGGDAVSIDSVAVVDPDFVSTGDIDFVDTANTITANINAGAIVNADVNASAAIAASKLDSSLIVSTEIDTYGELNTIVADVTLTHNGLIDTFSELNTIVADKSLVNTADAATITADYDFGGGTLQIPNSTTLPASCEVGDSYMDTDATSGQRFYLCESANTWALQGDGGGGGGSPTLADIATNSTNTAEQTFQAVTASDIIFEKTDGTDQLLIDSSTDGIYVNRYLRTNQHGSTYIQVGDSNGYMDFIAAGKVYLYLGRSSQYEMNPTNADIDIIGQGDTVNNIIHLDASLDDLIFNGDGSPNTDIYIESDTVTNAFFMDSSADEAQFNVDLGVGTLKALVGSANEWRFNSNEQQAVMQGNDVFSITAPTSTTGTVYINKNNLARDFHVDSDNVEQIFFVDGSADEVSFGGDTKLHQGTDMSSETKEGQISWDTDDDKLTVGTGSAAYKLSPWVEVDRQTASNSASINVDISGSFDVCEITLLNVVPATDGTALKFQTSTDGGTTFDSTAGDYKYSGNHLETTGTTETDNLLGNSNSSSVQVTWGDLGSDVGEAFSGEVTFYDPDGTGYTYFRVDGSYLDSGGLPVSTNSAGLRTAAADVDTLQFTMDSGNIESGTFVSRCK